MKVVDMHVLRIGAASAFALATLTAPAVQAGAGIAVYPLKAAGFMPDSVVRAADGSVWFSAAKLRPCPKEETCQSEELGSVGTGNVRERKLGDLTIASEGYGVTAGPNRTLWVTDPLRAAHVYDLSGQLIAKVPLSDRNGSGALSPPFIGPDGRMWFTQGSFGSGADGVVAVDSAFRIQPVAPCGQCFFASGVVAADGNAWLLDPYLGGFYRVTTAGKIKRFDYGKFTLASMIAGPRRGLWGLTNSDTIAAYDLDGALRASFSPGVPVQSGLRDIDGLLWWANFRPSQTGNQLDVVSMTPAGAIRLRRFHNVGACTSQNKQWFSNGPALGGDGALYVGIGCAPQPIPYTVGGQAAIVRIAP